MGIFIKFSFAYWFFGDIYIYQKKVRRGKIDQNYGYDFPSFIHFHSALPFARSLARSIL